MRSCMFCGCTDGRACMTADGPCSWYSLDPPICTACVVGEDAAGEPIFRDASAADPLGRFAGVVAPVGDAGEFGPVDPTAFDVLREPFEAAAGLEHVHRIIYSSPTAGYCIECGTPAWVDGRGETQWADGAQDLGAFDPSIDDEGLAA